MRQGYAVVWTWFADFKAHGNSSLLLPFWVFAAALVGAGAFAASGAGVMNNPEVVAALCGGAALLVAAVFPASRAATLAILAGLFLAVNGDKLAADSSSLGSMHTQSAYVGLAAFMTWMFPGAWLSPQGTTHSRA